ncbi:hypothetical protein Pth03_67970 [Planotetraspora thailandica]|uniref:histidine kinase n=1 Tax=Planotetraspora thailandica TaxID=487172 RepID=A0A8J4DD87_9ACTN|nr:HAMP domain-containing sensor histidine kinase [Planotetraspora thailandica]GII58408.1 hypothetical protein Pth03_67970 [Planotetraspora thailandica]
MTSPMPPSDRGDAAAAHPHGRFAADAAHELCTPVAALRVELEEARLHPSETDLIELLDRALVNVDRLQAIVTDLLTLARAQAAGHVDRQRVDLADLVSSEVARRSDRLQTVVSSAGQGVAAIVVDVDRFQLRRVLAILLDNAHRHARNSVRVEVRWDGESAELSVADDGPGIAPEHRERIFEPFSRLDPARDRRKGGAGLGLAIAKEIVRAHGGTVEVDSSPGGGARFVVRLPVARLLEACQRAETWLDSEASSGEPLEDRGDQTERGLGTFTVEDRAYRLRPRSEMVRPAQERWRWPDHRPRTLSGARSGRLAAASRSRASS